MTSGVVCLIVYLEATIALEDHRFHWTDKGILSTHTKVKNSCPRPLRRASDTLLPSQYFCLDALYSPMMSKTSSTASHLGMAHGSLHCLDETPGINLTPFLFCPTFNPSLNPDFNSFSPPFPSARLSMPPSSFMVLRHYRVASFHASPPRLPSPQKHVKLL